MLAEAQALADECEERWWQAELYRLKGELMLKRRGAPGCHKAIDDDEPERCFRQALAIARAQKAKSLELRAAMSLSRLQARQFKRSEAQETSCKGIFASFTEGSTLQTYRKQS